MTDIVLAIVGSRTFKDYDLMDATLGRVNSNIVKVVSGGAKGADRLGAVWAKKHGILVDEYIPNWSMYGKSAGFKRNQSIVDASDALMAFWDGTSKGTKHSIDLAKKKGIPYHIVRFDLIEDESDVQGTMFKKGKLA